MESLWRDLMYGARGLRREPGFAALAILTLALGIGAATAMFSVIQNVLLDPFPYNAERVVMFQVRTATEANQQGGRTAFSTPEFLDLREAATSFEDVIGGGYEEILYTTNEGTERLQGAVVTGNTFDFLGVSAIAGRTLKPEDALPGAPPVFVMNHQMWRRYFAEDREIIGRTLILNGTPCTCVGVMPPRFTKQAADLYRPITLDRAAPDANGRYYMFQGRLKPGVTLEQAEAEFSLITQRLAKTYPRNYPEKFVVKGVWWIDNVVRNFKTTLLTLAAAVALLLLIACVNVANMLLARAASRGKEMAVRMALGASRGRLIGQLLAESLLLAVLGATAGCGFAYLGLKFIVATIPVGTIPREAVIQLNVPVLIFSLVAAVFTAVLFGLVPAWQTVRRDLVEPLKDSGKGGGSNSRGGKLRAGLVVAEVTLSLILLAGAGLLMRSFVKMQSVPLGFEPKNVLIGWLSLPRGTTRTAEQKTQYYQQLLPRLKALPGVTSVTTMTGLPPFNGVRSDVVIPGQAATTETRRMQLEFCSEGYFETLKIALLRGRLLTEQDIVDARPVMVINQTLAQRYFPNEDPLGRTIELARLATFDGRTAAPAFEIIGITADAQNGGINEPPGPYGYVPYSVTGLFGQGVMLRTVGEPLALLQTVRREIWAHDRSAAMSDFNSYERALDEYLYAEPRFSLIVLGIFAAAGLVLVTLGVYSVIAYSVARRTQELGIRMALGASRADVQRLVLISGLKLVGLGLAIGTVVSVALARVLANQLWQVKPHDPVTLVIVAVVVTLTGVCACWFPARRATKVDPLVALRCE